VLDQVEDGLGEAAADVLPIIGLVSRLAEQLELHPRFMIGGSMACSAVVFSGLLSLSGLFSTQFGWALESLLGGIAVLGFFVSVLAALCRMLHLNLPVFASSLAVLGLLGVVGSFWLPARGFPGSPGYHAHWGYIFFSVFSGCWYMLVLGIAGSLRRLKGSAN
jgi:hypothetical protein